LLDQAGWHLLGKLAVPDKITIAPLPPKCLELNPQGNVWQFIAELHQGRIRPTALPSFGQMAPKI
jgi:hypothetical protein